MGRSDCAAQASREGSGAAIVLLQCDCCSSVRFRPHPAVISIRPIPALLDSFRAGLLLIFEADQRFGLCVIGGGKPR
jgi:hypothetical protein